MSGPRPRPDALLVAGDVATDLLAFVEEVRAAGRTVVLATDNPDQLADRFDAVVSTDGKPSREFFAAACDAAQTAPERCLFVDGIDRNVRGARAAGLSAYRYGGADDLRYLRAALGL
jgi:putative hydrolase of the HAD superfamily